MLYDVSLKWVALTIGLIYLGSHLPGALAPQPYMRFVNSLPRNYGLGVLLVAAAGLWFAILTATMDLGELSPMRNTLVITWVVGAVATIFFMPVFLTVRGLAMLMLLSVAVMLDAAFLVETPVRLVVTILAYIWAITGIVLMGAPFLMRESLHIVFKTPKRCQIACALGSVFGVLLIALGLFVYP